MKFEKLKSSLAIGSLAAASFTSLAERPQSDERHCAEKDALSSLSLPSPSDDKQQFSKREERMEHLLSLSNAPTINQQELHQQLAGLTDLRFAVLAKANTYEVAPVLITPEDRVFTLSEKGERNVRFLLGELSSRVSTPVRDVERGKGLVEGELDEDISEIRSCISALEGSRFLESHQELIGKLGESSESNELLSVLDTDHKLVGTIEKKAGLTKTKHELAASQLDYTIYEGVRLGFMEAADVQSFTLGESSLSHYRMPLWLVRINAQWESGQIDGELFRISTEDETTDTASYILRGIDSEKEVRAAYLIPSTSPETLHPVRELRDDIFKGYSQVNPHLTVSALCDRLGVSYPLEERGRALTCFHLLFGEAVDTFQRD